MEEKIINRVAGSALKSIDLEDYLDKSESVTFDLASVLYQGLILREQPFRDFLKSHDWLQYTGKNVLITCSTDAIVPTWAYMLLVSKLGHARLVVSGSADDLEKALILQAVRLLAQEDFVDAKVVIKGCGAIQNKEFAYTEITKALLPHVSSLMYGEPCSTVPVYKRPKG